MGSSLQSSSKSPLLQRSQGTPRIVWWRSSALWYQICMCCSGTRYPASFPPAYQVEHPFGVDIGGAHPQLLALRPEASADSWLSVGVTDGDMHSAVGSIGVPFADWSGSHGLSFDDGAVFWTDPREAGHHVADMVAASGQRVVILAQLTVPSGQGFTAQLAVQGYLHNRNTGVGSIDGEPVHNSWAEELTFSMTPGDAASTTAAHEPAVEAAPSRAVETESEAGSSSSSSSSLCSEHQLALLRHCIGPTRCRRCNKRRLFNYLESCGLADGTLAVAAAGCHAQHHPLLTPTTEYVVSRDDEMERLLAWVEATEH